MTMYAVLLLISISISKAVEITVTGPLVDLWCWDDNDGIALDTGDSLKTNPYSHTVHCLVEVPKCKNSGFAIVHQPDGADEYEIQYLLDDTGNELAIDEMLLLPAGYGGPRWDEVGFIIVATGTTDNAGDRPILNVTSLSQATDSPTTLAPTMNPTTDSPTMNPTTSQPTTAKPTLPEGETYPPTTDPTTSAPSTVAPTMNPTTTKPTMNPTTAAPTTEGPEIYETCVEATEIVHGVTVKIGRQTSDEMVQIIITGHVDKYSGVGFGAQKMEGTYAIIVDGKGTEDIMERILGDHKMGSELSGDDRSFTSAVSNSNDGSVQTVIINRPYSGGAGYDFTDLMTCQVDSINAISAKGHSYDFVYHADREIGTLTRVCDCDSDDDPLGSSDGNRILMGIGFIISIVAMIGM